MTSDANMPAARIGDVDSGHPSAGPTPVNSGSATVLIAGRAAARKGDVLVSHHAGVRTIAEGAETVLIEGKPAARVGDAINCGGELVVGAASVVIGDKPKSARNNKRQLEFELLMEQILEPKNAKLSVYEQTQLAADIALKHRGNEGAIATWHDYFYQHETEPPLLTDSRQLEGHARAKAEKSSESTYLEHLETTADSQEETQKQVDRLGQSMLQLLHNAPADASVTPEISAIAAQMLNAAGIDAETAGLAHEQQLGANNQPGSNPVGRVTPRISQSTIEGESVNMVTGEKLLELEDFVLHGPLTMIWRRIYRSSNAGHCGLGVGWTYPGSETIELQDDHVIYTDQEARRIVFERPHTGGRSINYMEKLQLRCVDGENFIVYELNQPERHFNGKNSLKLSALIDECGNRLDFYYHKNNHQLSHIRTSWGQIVSFRWHQGCINEIVRLGHQQQKTPLVKYEYNDELDLITCIDGRDKPQRYQYRNHLMTRRTLKSGFNINFEWNQYSPHGQCVSQQGDKGVYSYRFEWNNEQRISRAIDSRGAVWEYHYSESAKVTRKIDAEGLETNFDYDVNGNLLQRIRPAGIDRYEYNEMGQLTSYLDASGGGYHVDYENNREVQITDALGNKWSRSYYDNGLLHQSIDPEGRVTEHVYNALGLVTKTIEPTGVINVYDWDEQGRLSARRVNQCQTSFQYDSQNRVTTETEKIAAEQPARVTRYHYNDRDNITTVQYPDDSTCQLQYNVNNQLTSYTDVSGRVTQHLYDGLYQVRETIDPMGNVIEYYYDYERNLVGLTNANGECYQLKYDLNKRLIEEVGFDGRVQQYQYDEQGQLCSHVEGRHQGDAVSALHTTHFRRDAMGRLLEKSVQGKVIAKYAYDNNGRLISAINPHCTVSFEYTASGQLAKEVQGENTIKHYYNSLGQRRKTVFPGNLEMAIKYDRYGQWMFVQFDTQQLVSVRRNEWGELLHRKQGSIDTQYEYDLMGRLICQRSVSQQTKQALIQRTYQFDWMGNVGKIDDLRKGNVRYRYDVLNRLKQVSGWVQEKFEFDPAGNLLTPDTNIIPKEGNRLTRYRDCFFEYNSLAGNLTTESREKNADQKTLFEYNSQNQLIRLSRNGQLTRYYYDALGRRVKKKTGNEITKFLWSGDVIVNEKKNDVEKYYLYEPGTFKPLAQVHNNQVFHYHLDHLGTPQEMTSQNGEIVWSAHYSAYANLVLIDVESTQNNLRFQGQYYDEESGLHYNRHRYYNPNTGRYLSQDPMGLLGEINYYQYVNNPISWVGPYGLSNKELTTSDIRTENSNCHCENIPQSYRNVKLTTFVHKIFE